MPTGSRLAHATGGTYSWYAIHHGSDAFRCSPCPPLPTCAAEPESRISLLALLSRRRATSSAYSSSCV